MIRWLLRRLLPQKLKKMLQGFHILFERYNYRGSILRSACIDRAGDATPWYTYPAIEYLSGLDFSACRVLEFGAGASSLWWARRAGSVVSIESDPAWYERLESPRQANLEIRFAADVQAYLAAAGSGRFDVIVIDGIHRQLCAEHIGSLIAAGGMVILDNSDWHPVAARYLREHYDLIQVDFHGFGPINGYTWTTSIFLSRSFVVRPATARLPGYSAGAIIKLAEGQ